MQIDERLIGRPTLQAEFSREAPSLHVTPLPLPPGWNTTFHEFSVERGAAHVAFALDGEVTLNVTTAAFWNVPFYLILNTALGGGWPGAVNASTRLPARHRIDYVRVSRPS